MNKMTDDGSEDFGFDPNNSNDNESIESIDSADDISEFGIDFLHESMSSILDHFAARGIILVILGKNKSYTTSCAIEQFSNRVEWLADVTGDAIQDAIESFENSEICPDCGGVVCGGYSEGDESDENGGESGISGSAFGDDGKCKRGEIRGGTRIDPSLN